MNHCKICVVEVEQLVYASTSRVYKTSGNTNIYWWDSRPGGEESISDCRSQDHKSDSGSGPDAWDSKNGSPCYGTRNINMEIKSGPTIDV